MILLSEGRLLYHGPTSCLDVYLASLGYVRPAYMDTAAFAIEVVSSPLDAALLSVRDQATVDASAGDSSAAASSAGNSGSGGVGPGSGVEQPLYRHPSVLPVGPPVRPRLLTVNALADAWAASAWAQAMMTTGPVGLPLLICRMQQHQQLPLTVLPVDTAQATPAVATPAKGGGLPLPQSPAAAFTAPGAGRPVAKAPSPRRASTQMEGSAPKSTPLPVSQSATALREAELAAELAASARPMEGGVPLTSAYAQQQYGSLYTKSFPSQVWHTTAREMRLAKRNWLYSGARLVNAVAMGAILGLVYFQVSYAVTYCSKDIVSRTSHN